MPRFLFFVFFQIPLALFSQTLQKVIIEPCSTLPAEEFQNELISMTTESTPFEVGDLQIHTINTTAAIQPDVTYAWSGSGTDNGGNPIDICPGGGMTCLRWLDHADPIDGPIIATLVTELNTHVGPCTPTLFVAPTGPNLGTIPANSRLLIFTAAGGNNSGTPGFGFDGLGTNLDFTSYCNSPEIYVIFGINMNPFHTGGMLSNAGPRAVRVQLSGVTVDSLFYPANPGGAVPDVVDSVGMITYGGPCTPSDLFGILPLEAMENPPIEYLSEIQDLQRVICYPNPASDALIVKLPFDGPQTIRQKIYSLDGKSTEIRTLDLQKESNTLLVEVQHLPSATYFLELMTDNGAFRALFVKE